jgi:hypothetical protein
VTAEPESSAGVRYRLRSARRQIAQRFPAALVPDWHGPLDALTDHRGQHARGSA